MKLIRQYKGDCIGVQLYERPDMNKQFNIIVEDDEGWHESGFHASAYWIDELIEMLTLAKQYLDNLNPPHDAPLSQGLGVEVGDGEPLCSICGEPYEARCEHNTSNLFIPEKDGFLMAECYDWVNGGWKECIKLKCPYLFVSWLDTETNHRKVMLACSSQSQTAGGCCCPNPDTDAQSSKGLGKNCPKCQSEIKPSQAVLNTYICQNKNCGIYIEGDAVISNGMERDEICNITCRKKYADCNSPACWRRLAWEKEDNIKGVI